MFPQAVLRYWTPLFMSLRCDWNYLRSAGGHGANRYEKTGGLFLGITYGLCRSWGCLLSMNMYGLQWLGPIPDAGITVLVLAHCSMLVGSDL